MYKNNTNDDEPINLYKRKYYTPGCNMIDGRRIVNLKSLALNLFCINENCNNILSIIDTEEEYYNGLSSILFIRCRYCLAIKQIYTDNEFFDIKSKQSYMDVNRKFVEGCLSLNIFYSNMTKLLNTLEIPEMTYQSYNKHVNMINYNNNYYYNYHFINYQSTSTDTTSYDSNDEDDIIITIDNDFIQKSKIDKRLDYQKFKAEKNSRINTHHDKCIGTSDDDNYHIDSSTTTVSTITTTQTMITKKYSDACKSNSNKSNNLNDSNSSSGKINKAMIFKNSSYEQNYDNKKKYYNNKKYHGKKSDNYSGSDSSVKSFSNDENNKNYCNRKRIDNDNSFYDNNKRDSSTRYSGNNKNKNYQKNKKKYTNDNKY